MRSVKGQARVFLCTLETQAVVEVRIVQGSFGHQ